MLHWETAQKQEAKSDMGYFPLARIPTTRLLARLYLAGMGRHRLDDFWDCYSGLFRFLFLLLFLCLGIGMVVFGFANPKPPVPPSIYNILHIIAIII